MKLDWSLFATLLLLPLGGCNRPSVEQVALQKRFTTEIQQALTHFQRLQRADTLDFGKLTPFDWDTVYVFENYTDGYHIAHDMDRGIDWHQVMTPTDAVPEETNRFIFVKGNEAVQYVDVSTNLIGEAHFAKYYPDTLNQVTTNYFDSAGNVHMYTVNHFAKADARFILVCAVSIPDGDSVRGAYLPLRLLKEQRFSSLGVTPTNLVDLHPLSGCGYVTCLANLSRHLE